MHKIIRLSKHWWPVYLVAVLMMGLFSGIVFNNSHAAEENNTAGGKSLFSKAGRYKVDTYYNKAWSMPPLNSDGTFNVKLQNDIKVNSGDKIEKAYIMLHHEDADIAKTLDISTPKGQTTLNVTQSYTLGEGMAEYVDITDLVKKDGNGSYGINNIHIRKTKWPASQVAGWYALGAVVITENPNNPYNLVNLSDFSAFDGNGVEQLNTSTDITIPTGFKLANDAKMSLATQITTPDVDDYLSINYVDKNNKTTSILNKKFRGSATDEWDRWFSGSAKVGSNTNQLHFDFAFKNNGGSDIERHTSETIMFLLSQIDVEPAGAIYSYVDENGGGIGQGINASSNPIYDSDGNQVNTVIDKDGKISIYDFLPGEQIPNLRTFIPGYTFKEENTHEDTFQPNGDVNVKYTYTANPQSIHVKYVDDDTGDVVHTSDSTEKTGITFDYALWDYHDYGYDLADKQDPKQDDLYLSDDKTEYEGTYTTSQKHEGDKEEDQYLTIHLKSAKSTIVGASLDFGSHMIGEPGPYQSQKTDDNDINVYLGANMRNSYITAQLTPFKDLKTYAIMYHTSAFTSSSDEKISSVDQFLLSDGASHKITSLIKNAGTITSSVDNKNTTMVVSNSEYSGLHKTALTYSIVTAP